MTNEEAIEIINRENDPNDKKVWEVFPEYREALDMAIKALSQEPCDDAEQIDYHDDFETASRKIHDYEERQKQNDKKCCSDCKLNGTDICYIVCGGSKSLYKPKQKSESCTDAVSRQAVLDTEYQIKDINGVEYVMLSEVQMKMRKLPPVTHKSGKWIDEGWYAEGHSEHAYRCSECDEHYIGYVGEYKYCPNCGAKMKSEG